MVAWVANRIGDSRNGNVIGIKKPLDTVTDGKINGRKVNGQFAPGNKCGRGNPHARKLSAMRQAFTSVVDEKRLMVLAESIYKRAIEGDIPAAKLLLNYVIGKPVQAVNPDRLDIEEWELVAQAPTTVEMIAAMSQTSTPEAAVGLVSHLQTKDVDKLRIKLRKTLQDNEGALELMEEATQYRRRKILKKKFSRPKKSLHVSSSNPGGSGGILTCQ